MEIEILNNAPEVSLRRALGEVAIEAARVIDFQDCAIALYDSARNELITLATSNPTLDTPNKRFRPGEGIAGHVARTLRPAVVPDVSKDPRFISLGPRQISSALCVPILREDRMLLGTITAVSPEKGAFGTYQLKLLEILADMASLSISQIMRAQELRTLNNIGQRLLDINQVEEVFELLRDGLSALVPMDLLRLQLTEPIFGESERQMCWTSQDTISTPVECTIDLSLGDHAWIVTDEDLAALHKLNLYDLTYKSFVTIPLRTADELLGFLLAGSLSPLVYTHDHIGTMETVGTQIALWLRNRKLNILEKSQTDRLETLFTSSSDAILIVSSGRIARINPSAAKMLGISQEEGIGEHLDSVLQLTPCSPSADDGSPLYHVLTPTGLREVELSVFTLSEDSVEHVILTLRDVTEQRELDRAKANFISMISHELRTPLNSVLGFTDILLTETAGPITDHQREFLGYVKSSSRHLVQLVNDILDLSRMDAGNFRLDIGPVIPEIIAQRVVDELLGLSQKSGIRLTLDIEPDLPNTRGDGRRLEQVLINLVANALKMTSEDGQVKVRVSSTPTHIIFSVQDTGPGIPDSEKEKIFERFYQTVSSPREATKGTGLGLAIAKYLVEAHDGEIWLQSEVGKGSTFFFSVPVVRG